MLDGREGLYGIGRLDENVRLDGRGRLKVRGDKAARRERGSRRGRAVRLRGWLKRVTRLEREAG